jgi:hypothetical protein
MSRYSALLLGLAACGHAAPTAVDALPGEAATLVGESAMPAPPSSDSLAGAPVIAQRTSDGWEERTTRAPVDPADADRLGMLSSAGFGSETAAGMAGSGEGWGGLGLVGTGVGGGGAAGSGIGIGGLGTRGLGAGRGGYGAAAAPSGGKPGFSTPERKLQPLRAGSTDDNAAYPAWLATLSEWSARPDLEGRFQPLDVRAQQPIRVLDAEGRPVPDARVVVQGGQSSLNLRTYGDGAALYRPGLAGLGPTLQVTVTADGQRAASAWDGASPLTLTLPGPARVAARVPVDAVILLDTTGSMQDEIDAIKATLVGVTRDLEALDRPADLRWGAVLYRDKGDDYLTRRSAFTSDVAAFRRALEGVEAGGGGDGPESLNQGLYEAVNRMDWRPDAARVVFLVADAPPHMDYQGDVPYGDSARRAASEGIRVHAVAASGLDDAGSLVFRQVAQLTRGRFIFIEYGSFEASAADHGVTAPVQGNNLGAILFEQVRAEVDAWAGGSRVASR